MFDRWSERVGPEDVVLHLGDLMDAFCYYVRDLPGRKLMIRGNMDRYDEGMYREVGFEVLGRGDKPFFWEFDQPVGKKTKRRLVAFSHEPLGAKGEEIDWDLNIHGHIHEGPLWTHRYEPGNRFNVSVDATDLEPVRLLWALAALEGRKT